MLVKPLPLVQRLQDLTTFPMLESTYQTSHISALYLVNSSSVLHPQITSPLVVVFKKKKAQTGSGIKGRIVNPMTE